VASWQANHPPERLARTWTAYRQVGDGLPAFWVANLANVGTPQPEGRWHTEGQTYAQYLSLSVTGAWCELLRFEHIRTDQARRTIDHSLYKTTIREHDIADLSTFDKIREAGLDVEEFVSDSLAYCQQLAGELLRESYRGLLSPSAALHRTETNLTLFGPRRETDKPRSKRGSYWITTEALANHAAPPLTTMAVTRYKGEEHEGLKHWQIKGH